MFQRTLPRDATLWWESDHAESIAVIDSGRVGVRRDGQLVGIAFPGTVVGESAILTLDGPPARRTGTVFALAEGTEVTEYPVAAVRELFDAGVPHLVLRTLFGQICCNALLVLGANEGRPIVGTALFGLVESMRRCEREIGKVTDWDAFVLAFRFLYHHREGVDATRRDLVPDDELTAEVILSASQSVKSMFQTPDVIDYLDSFLNAERDRTSRGSA